MMLMYWCVMIPMYWCVMMLMCWCVMMPCWRLRLVLTPTALVHVPPHTLLVQQRTLMWFLWSVFLLLTFIILFSGNSYNSTGDTLYAIFLRVRSR